MLLGICGPAQENSTTIVYTKFGGQKERIMGKIEDKILLAKFLNFHCFQIMYRKEKYNLMA